MTSRESRLRIVAFAGASNWPIWIGLKKELFARERLDVTLEITPNSKQMAMDVHEGKYNIALTAIDNVVAYVEGQGEVQLTGPVDFVAFMGVDDGMLSLMAAKGTGSIGDLRGKDIAVDAMTTGFAFVLREVLLKSNIGLDDVTFVAVGGGAQRLAALRDGKQTATLLNAPLDLIAEGAGAVRLVDTRGLIGAYQGISGMARKNWLAQNRDVAKSFIRGFQASVAWLTDRANKAEAIEILREHVQGTSSDLAEAIYARLTDPKRGIRRDVSIDPDGLATVLRLRSKHSMAGKTLDDPARYLDATLRGEALAG